MNTHCTVFFPRISLISSQLALVAALMASPAFAVKTHPPESKHATTVTCTVAAKPTTTTEYDESAARGATDPADTRVRSEGEKGQLPHIKMPEWFNNEAYWERDTKTLYIEITSKRSWGKFTHKPKQIVHEFLRTDEILKIWGHKLKVQQHGITVKTVRHHYVQNMPDNKLDTSKNLVQVCIFC